jgi:hypothetical protein
MHRLHMRFALLLVVCAGLILGSLPAGAIPVFARKYGFNCTMCHSGFPRLNDFGTRYRQNGYQLPGREDEDRTVLTGLAPFAARTTAGYDSDRFSNSPDAEEINQFRLNGLDLLSAGLIRRNIAYVMVYPPKIEASRGVAGQPGTLEMANVVFSNVGSSWLNIRAGRFEPAYLAFSVKRQYTVSPYDIYSTVFPNGSPLTDTQEGIELTGYGRCGLSYAAGWVNGSQGNYTGDTPADVYVRLAKVFGAGEGMTAGQRIGVTGYWGKARPFGAGGGDGYYDLPRESFQRIGVDTSLNAGRFNLSAQYLWGRDNSELWDAGSDVSFNGGFVEALYMPSFDVVGFARYDWVNTPDAMDMDTTRWTVGGRFYFEDNLALHLEYSHGELDSMGGPNPTENFYTLRLDFAF